MFSSRSPLRLYIRNASGDLKVINAQATAWRFQISQPRVKLQTSVRFKKHPRSDSRANPKK